jgi:hypothetical protein
LQGAGQQIETAITLGLGACFRVGFLGASFFFSHQFLGHYRAVLSLNHETSRTKADSLTQLSSANVISCTKCSKYLNAEELWVAKPSSRIEFAVRRQVGSSRADYVWRHSYRAANSEGSLPIAQATAAGELSSAAPTPRVKSRRQETQISQFRSAAVDLPARLRLEFIRIQRDVDFMVFCVRFLVPP